MALTPRQARFIDEYLLDLNATQAAIRAGFSPKTANRAGPRLLSNVVIAAEVAARKDARAAKVQVSQEYVLANLTEVLERTMQRAPVLEFDRGAKRYVQAKDEQGRDVWTFDARNAVGSLSLLAKHVGGFSDKHEHQFTGPLEVRVVVRREGRKTTAG